MTEDQQRREDERSNDQFHSEATLGCRRQKQSRGRPCRVTGFTLSGGSCSRRQVIGPGPSRDRARLAQHLADLRGMRLFGGDLRTGVLLEHYVASGDRLEELA